MNQNINQPSTNTLTDVQRRDIQSLRQAIDARLADQTQFYIKRLFMGAPYYYSIAVVMDALQLFLPTFETIYPDEIWVRQLLLSVNSFGTAPSDTVAEMALNQQFDAPGVMNFLKAVYDLTQAMNDKHTNEARVGFITSSVVNVVMASVVHNWYGTREKAWIKVRKNRIDPATGQYTDPVATEIAYKFWTDEATITYEKETWHRITDALERALQR